MNAIHTNIFVRKADESEADKVLDLYIECLWPIAHFQPHLPTVGVEIYNAVREGRVFVVQRDDELIGCAGYQMLRPWYLEKPQLWDQGIMVKPRWRKSRAAFLLLSALEIEAVTLGATFILSANTQNEETAKICDKRYRKIADVYVVRE